MNSDIILSLCIPTNGVVEWVSQVIDSIYSEANSINNFEVIVTDNGNNKKFNQLMKEYEKKYNNLIYHQTSAIQFQNQIEAFKLAKGEFIKFINHRMKFLPGTLNYLIDYARNNSSVKPVTYFSNGVLNKNMELIVTNSFDQYIEKLSYFSSWSAGVAVWKKDFEKIPKFEDYNEYFPHINLMFANKNSEKYIIVNKVLMEEIVVDDTKKGKYDLFHAFACEYIDIIEKLYIDGEISKSTYEHVKKDNKKFIAALYYKYVLKKNPCSYDLNGFDIAIKRYYKKREIYAYIPKYVIMDLRSNIAKMIK